MASSVIASVACLIKMMIKMIKTMIKNMVKIMTMMEIFKKIQAWARPCGPKSHSHVAQPSPLLLSDDHNDHDEYDN